MGRRLSVLHNRRLVLTLVALLGVATGCDLIDPPFHRMELSGTKWTVVEVGQSQLETSVELVFLDPYEFEVRSNCGTLSGSYGRDTDASLLEFFGFEDAPTSCGDEEEAERDLVADALRSNVSWEIIDQDAIRLEGSDSMELTRSSGSP
jgi:hypothetical protein